MLTAFVNSVMLLYISLNLFHEALERLFEPPEIKSDRLLVVSIAGFLVNLVGIFAFEHGGQLHSHGHSHGHDDHDHHHHDHDGHCGPSHHDHAGQTHGMSRLMHGNSYIVCCLLVLPCCKACFCTC